MLSLIGCIKREEKFHVLSSLFTIKFHPSFQKTKRVDFVLLQEKQVTANMTGLP